MAITVVPSVVTGQTYSAANFNTHVRDNINGIWVLTTAGDMLYATGASAAARLALVPGGVMYGGASAPAWLATPSVASVLKKVSGTSAPSWLSIAGFPGRLHTKGFSFTDSGDNTTDTSYVAIGSGLKVSLSLSQTCTVIGIAFGAATKDSASAAGYFKLKIDGTIDPNENVQFRNTLPTPFSTFYYRTGITAGTRDVELMFRTGSGSDAITLNSGAVMALAFVDG